MSKVEEFSNHPTKPRAEALEAIAFWSVVLDEALDGVQQRKPLANESREGYDPQYDPQYDNNVAKTRENCSCSNSLDIGSDSYDRLYKLNKSSKYESFTRDSHPTIATIQYEQSNSDMFDPTVISCNANFQVPGNASCQSSRATPNKPDNAVNPAFNLGGMVAYGL